MSNSRFNKAAYVLVTAVVSAVLAAASPAWGLTPVEGQTYTNQVAVEAPCLDSGPGIDTHVASWIVTTVDVRGKSGGAK